MDEPTARDRLLDAAETAFDEQGFGAAVMDQIRRAAGASNGSLYHHFATKGALADGVYARILLSLHSALLAALDDGQPARQAVPALVQRFGDWVLQHPRQARLLQQLRHPGAVGEHSQATLAANGAGLAQLADWVAARTQAGEMRPLPLPVWMALVFAPSITLAPHWSRQQPPHIAPAVRHALAQGAWAAVAPLDGGR
jgi:AcrR family transcriptional regulator